MPQWIECTIGSRPGGDLTIQYHVEATVQQGLQIKDTQSAWGWPGAIAGKNEQIVEPGRIDVKAKLRLGAVHPGVTGDVVIGFVQSLTSCERQAKYGPSPQQTKHVFERGHPQYPVKDGEGAPWYKEADPKAIVRVSCAPLGKYVSGGNRFISPEVAVWDKPKFGYPPTLNGEPLQAVNCDDHFLTCLTVHYRGTFYALHQIHWRYRVWKTSAGKPNGTLSLDGSSALRPPYTMPPQIQMTGLSANRSEQMKLNGTLIR